MLIEKKQTQPACEKTVFGAMPNGETIHEYVLSNSKGVRVGILDYGGIIRYIKAPDRTGHISDIVLGFDDLDAYLHDQSNMGAIIGRYANRIAGGVFELDDIQVHLDKNEAGNCLHGGSQGFGGVVWKAMIDQTDPSRLQLSHLSFDGEQGFPGNVLTTVSYTLTESNQLTLDITAMADKRTIMSITAHPYFNLSNDHSKDATKHLISIKSKKIFAHESSINTPGGCKGYCRYCRYCLRYFCRNTTLKSIGKGR